VKTTFQRWAIFLLVFVATGALVGLYIGPKAASAKVTAGGDLPLQMIFSILYLLIFVWLLPERKRALALLFEERWILLLLLLALASTLWSVDPAETFRRALGLAGTTMAGLFIGMRYEPKQQIRILALCIGIAAVASLAAGLFYPSVGRTPDGAWQGVFYLKNALARVMTLGVVCFAFLAIGQRRNRIIYIAMMLLCGLLILLAKSATGIVVCAAMLALLPFRRTLRWPNRRLAAIVALVLVPVCLIAWNNHDAILLMLSRDSSLTGRLPLWHEVKLEILDRPMLGSGFAAFWTTPQADRYRDILGWDAPNAHNGFLDTALGLGFIGLAVLAMQLLRTLAGGILVAAQGDETIDAWPLFFLIYCFLYNLTESTLPVGNSVFWILYAANAYWLVSARKASSVREQVEYQPAPSIGALVESHSSH
jgi:exopolysaccharide production protein ExoQ